MGWSALLFCLVAYVPLAPANAAASALDIVGATPSGRWITPSHDTVIQIAPCGAQLCGEIVGMVLAPSDPVPKNWNGVSLCDLTIIRVTPEAEDDGRVVWRGRVVDPRDGSAYRARMSVGADHQLKLRGYFGLPIFGLTQSWAPYTGPDAAADCRLSRK
jgi:uncharacterized protein (DUF2147 family)